MSTTVAAEVRTGTGKSFTRKLRANGRIPGVIYGSGGTSTSITLDPKALLDVFRATQDANTIVTIDLGTEQVTTLVREAQRHPVSRALLHVDLYRIVPDSVVSVLVPVRGTGRPAGAAVGGRLEVLQRSVRVRCPANAIPAAIEVDSTPLDIGQVVRVHEVPTPESVTITSDRNLPLIACTGKKK
ncbi:MAG TPA: 50S ribosomal protein L25 [Myxococcota bacterium]|nr:50S ribosomal protein L25 [Myxococcota bacterium]